MEIMAEESRRLDEAIHWLYYDQIMTEEQYSLGERYDEMLKEAQSLILDE